MNFFKYALLLMYAVSLEIRGCFSMEPESYFYLLQSFVDDIGPGNYSYFKLSRQGNVRIFVETLLGDADIYVSQANSKPSFEDYDFKSVTCGEDYVDIPESFKRPTAIAIYGHPRYPETRFRCSVYLDARDAAQNDANFPEPHRFDTPEEDEHPGWLFLLKILEFVLDIAL
nr:UPF0669 protein C6orf120-like [Lytechinus pictus]